MMRFWNHRVAKYLENLHLQITECGCLCGHEITDTVVYIPSISCKRAYTFIWMESIRVILDNK